MFTFLETRGVHPFNFLMLLTRVMFAVLLFFLLLAGFAHAAAPGVKASLTVFWEWFTPFATTVIAAIGAWATSLAANKLKFNQGSQALDDFDQISAHGISMLEGLITSIASHNSTLTIPAAFSKVVDFMVTGAPGIATVLGFTPAALADFLTAHLSAASQAAVAEHVKANGPMTISRA